MAIEQRNNRQQVMEKVLRVKALVDAGERQDVATKRIGISGNTYRRYAKRGFKFTGVNIDMGTVSAASLPPRPTGGKGGKRPPKPVDMNSVESLAKRMSKIDKLLHGVVDLKTERKKIAGRLRSLLKV